jgi:hypothetical protein
MPELDEVSDFEDEDFGDEGCVGTKRKAAASEWEDIEEESSADGDIWMPIGRVLLYQPSVGSLLLVLAIGKGWMRSRQSMLSKNTGHTVRSGLES